MPALSLSLVAAANPLPHTLALALAPAGCALGLAWRMLAGPAMLALPCAVLHLGAVPAAAALLALAALSTLSCATLVASSAAAGLEQHRLSYHKVVAARLGPWAVVALGGAQALFSCGMTAASLAAAADAGIAEDWWVHGAPAWLGTALGSRPLVLAALGLVLAPLLGRVHKHATAACGLPVSAMVLWAVATLLLAVTQALRGEAHSLRPWPAPHVLRQPWHAALLAAVTLPVMLTALM